MTAPVHTPTGALTRSGGTDSACTLPAIATAVKISTWPREQEADRRRRRNSRLERMVDGWQSVLDYLEAE